MKSIIKQNRSVFIPANDAATKKFLAGKGSNLSQQPEPIGEVARRYHLESMTIDMVAAELSVTRKDLEDALRGDPVLQRLGLRILLRDGGTIKRAAWESPSEFPLMKQAARQFKFDPL